VSKGKGFLKGDIVRKVYVGRDGLTLRGDYKIYW